MIAADKQHTLPENGRRTDSGREMAVPTGTCAARRASHSLFCTSNGGGGSSDTDSVGAPSTGCRWPITSTLGAGLPLYLSVRAISADSAARRSYSGSGTRGSSTWRKGGGRRCTAIEMNEGYDEASEK